MTRPPGSLTVPKIRLIAFPAFEDISYCHDVDRSILRLIRVGVASKKRLNVGSA